MIRVVSLVPSVTETLLSWGISPVACTRFCEQPALRHVGGTKDPDIDAIVELGPDLVVVDEEENRLPDAEALLAAGLTLHAMAVRSVADVAPALGRLAAAVGAVAPTVDFGAPHATTGRRVSVLIWRRPWMALGCDTYGASVLTHLGYTVVAPGSGRYPTIDLGDLAGADEILLPTEPYAFTQRHVAEVSAAVPGAAVRLVDGKDLFWWGTRTAGALGRLATE